MNREFTLIEKLFKKRIKNAPLGVGDDGALIEKNKQTYYVLSQDTMLSLIHISEPTRRRGRGGGGVWG